MRPVEAVAVQWCHICVGTFLWQNGKQQWGALGLQVAWAASFEEVREHPHLYMTSTGPEEAPEKSTSSPTAMRAVEKHSPEQCYSHEPRNQPCLLPSFFMGALYLASTSICVPLKLQLLLLPQGLLLEPGQQSCRRPVVRHQTHQCKLHPDCWPCAAESGVILGELLGDRKKHHQKSCGSWGGGRTVDVLALDVNCRNFPLHYMIIPCGNDPCTHLAEQVHGIPPHSPKH